MKHLFWRLYWAKRGVFTKPGLHLWALGAHRWLFPAGSLYCWMMCHKWDMPGGHCEDCGECDEFFHLHRECA